MLIWIRRAIVALLLLGSAGYAASRGARATQASPRPALPAGAKYQESVRTADTWLHEGYVEVVSAIRPPTSNDGRVRIVVYVRFPQGGLVRPSGDGAVIEVPLGTRADRVEFFGDGALDDAPMPTWRVLDVRGIDFEPGGQHFRVLRPKTSSGHELLGIEWPRGQSQATVTHVLGELVMQGLVAAPGSVEERSRAAAHLESLNDCASCHVPRASGRRTLHDPGIVNRGTDGSGLFHVLSVLQDRQPFETYRPRDANRGDAWIARYCGTTRVDAATERCADGAVLTGELDVRHALESGDRHAQRVCASRRALRPYMDSHARALFQDSFAECGIGDEHGGGGALDVTP